METRQAGFRKLRSTLRTIVKGRETKFSFK